MAKKKEKMKAKTKQNGQDAINPLSSFQALALLDALPQNVYQKDVNGRFVFCNKSFLSNLGKSPEDVYGKTDHDLYPQEFAEKYTADDKKVLDTGDAVDVIEENQSPVTGEINYVHVVKTPVCNEKGDVIGTQGIWWDVTDRIEAETQLRESQARAQAMLDAMSFPMLISKLDDGKILYANEFLADLLRLSLDELVGNQTPNFYQTTQDRDRILKQIQDNGAITNYELQLLRNDGDSFWGAVSARTLIYDGEPAIMTTLRDISTRKQVTQAHEDALESTELQAHRLSLLNEFGAELNTAVSVNDVYQTTAKHLANIIPSDQASVALLTADNERFDMIMLTEELGEPFQLDVTDTVMELAIQEKRLIRLPKDASLEDYVDGRARLEAGLNAALSSPLIVQGKPIGVINIACNDVNAFQKADIGFVRQISSMLANALESRRLDERSRLLASIVENHPDFIGVGSLVGQALYVNPAGLTMMGLPSDYDVTQLIATDFYDETSAKILMDDAIPNALENGVWTGESNLKRTDDTVIPVDQIININYDTDNNPVSFAITMHDITERRMSELALRESEEQLQSLFEFAPDAIFIVNTKTGLFESANTNTEQLFGLSREELFKIGPADVSPKMQPNGLPSDEQAQGHNEAAMQGKNPVFEWMHTNGKGDEIPCEVRLTKLPGSDRLIRASVTDITERKEAERALRESEEQLQSLVEFAPEAIFVINTETGLFESPNTNTEQLFGLSYEEILKVGPAQTSPEIQPNGIPSDEQAMIQLGAAMQGKRPVFEWTHLNGKGDEFPCEVRLTKLPGSDRLIRASVTDITERKRAEVAIVKQATELQTVAEVSIAIATLTDPQEMLQLVVDLVKTSFGLYHAHVYLLNETEDTLVLTAGAGEAGKIMVAEKRTIPVSVEKSVVARAARTRDGVIINDVHAEEGFLPHPALPNTQSEMAVPLIVGERLLGVLDVQSDVKNGLSEEDMLVQATLASQIAIALNNARTFEESEKARKQLDDLTRRLTREGWENYMDSLTTDMSYSFGEEPSQADGEAAENKDVANNLIHPLNVQGESIGELALSLPDGALGEASEIVAAVAGSLSAHLENLRLTEQTQVALSETESLYNTSTRLNASTNLEQILESAFELPQKIGASSGLLHTFDLADNGLPEWANLVATIGGTSYKKGTRTYIPEFALANLWLNDPKGAVLVGDVAGNRSLDKKSIAAFKKEKTKALAILPLTVGTRKIGQIVFFWQQLRTFSDADQRIFNAIATQAASIVYNRLLFRQTDEALSETAALYQGSADLNTANTYLDVLKALRHHTLLGQNSSMISISYFNRPWVGDDVPEWVDILSFWTRKEADERSKIRYELDNFPSAATLLSSTKPTIIEDVDKDKRVGKPFKGLFKKEFKAKGVVFIPLVIGGQWVGYLTATYSKPIYFPDQEIRRTLALSRQAAVAVENVRLFVQTQTSLANLTTIQETTSQLTASSSFNEAVQALLPQLLKASNSELVRMFVVEDNRALRVGMHPAIEEKRPTTVIPLDKFPVLRAAVDGRATKSIFADDPNLTEMERKVFKSSGVSTMVAVPLVTKAGVLGFFTVSTGEQGRVYSEQEIGLLQTLADQATIAFERVRLLDDTTKRAQREQALRQIAAKVRGSADVDVVLRTAVEEVGKILGRQAYVYLQDGEDQA